MFRNTDRDKSMEQALGRKIRYTEKLVQQNHWATNWVNLLQELVQKRYPHYWEGKLPTYDVDMHGYACEWTGIKTAVMLFKRPRHSNSREHPQDDKKVAALTMLRHVMKKKKWAHVLELGRCMNNCTCRVMSNPAEYYGDWEGEEDEFVLNPTPNGEWKITEERPLRY